MGRAGRQNRNSWNPLVKIQGHQLKRQPKATCRKTERVMQTSLKSLEEGIAFPDQFGCTDAIAAKDLLSMILQYVWSLYKRNTCGSLIIWSFGIGI